LYFGIGVDIDLCIGIELGIGKQTGVLIGVHTGFRTGLPGA
jgi:hypothetical protein